MQDGAEGEADDGEAPPTILEEDAKSVHEEEADGLEEDAPDASSDSCEGGSDQEALEDHGHAGEQVVMTSQDSLVEGFSQLNMVDKESDSSDHEDPPPLAAPSAAPSDASSDAGEEAEDAPACPDAIQDEPQSENVMDPIHTDESQDSEYSEVSSPIPADGNESPEVYEIPAKPAAPYYRKELFESPMAGNSGPPLYVIKECCIALMNHLWKTHPAIMQYLGKRTNECPQKNGFPRFRHYDLPNYMSHCEWAFSRFGIRASSWLGSQDHFNQWLVVYRAKGSKDSRKLCNHVSRSSEAVSAGALPSPE